MILIVQSASAKRASCIFICVDEDLGTVVTGAAFISSCPVGKDRVARYHLCLAGLAYMWLKSRHFFAWVTKARLHQTFAIVDVLSGVRTWAIARQWNYEDKSVF